MRMKGAAVLTLLRDAGAEVDDTGTVRLPGRAGRARRRHVPARAAHGRRDAGRRTSLLDGSRTFFNVSGCAAKTLDQRDRRRAAIHARRPARRHHRARRDAGARRRLDLPDRDGRAARAARTGRVLHVPHGDGQAAWSSWTAPRRPTTCAASSRSRPATSSGSARGRACRCSARPARRSRSTASSWTWPASSPRWARPSGSTPCPSPAPRRRSRRPGTLALLWAEVLGTITAIQTAAPGAPGARLLRPRHPGHAPHHDVARQSGEHADGRGGGRDRPPPGHPGPQRGLSTDAKHAASRPGTRRGSR